MTNGPTGSLLVALNSGNLNLVSSNVIALSTVLNIPITSSYSNSTENELLNNDMADLREFLVEKVSTLSISDISSVKVISSALASATQSTGQISSKTAVKYFDFDFMITQNKNKVKNFLVLIGIVNW